MAIPNVLHVDLDAFFASAEQVRDPSLRGRPVIVGSAHEKRGVVAAASYEARPYGVRAGMPIFQARELCPDAVFLPGDFRMYLRFSRQVFELLEGISPAVERASLDEGYVDLSGCERLYGTWSAGPLGRLPFCEDAPGVYVRRESQAVPPGRRTTVPQPWRWVAAMGLWIKRLVKARTGLNVSVGCAANKLVAKTASDCAKPNAVVLVAPGSEEDFFLTLPLGDIPGMGRAVLEKLRRWNVRTVADARRLPREVLGAAFGDRHGPAIHRALRGVGEAGLARPALPRSVSRETTFWEASNDRTFVEGMLFYLTERVGNALRRDALAGRTVHLRVRYDDFSTVVSSRSLREPTFQDEEIFGVARMLLSRRWLRSRRMRLVGVGVSGLRPAAQRQVRLFDDGGERRRRLDGCLDRLRERFGFGVVQRGPSIELATRLEGDATGYKLRTPALSR